MLPESSGHTHEDIDQLFSVISRALSKHKIIKDPDSLSQFLREQVWKQPPIVVQWVTNVLDIEARYAGKLSKLCLSE